MVIFQLCHYPIYSGNPLGWGIWRDPTPWITATSAAMTVEELCSAQYLDVSKITLFST